MEAIPSKSKKLSPSLKKILLDFGGSLAVEIFNVLQNSTEMITSEKIIELLKTDPKTVRKILYLLRDAGLLSTHSIPDPKTRYLEFYWEINVDNLDKFILNRQFSVKDKLESRLEYEQENFFFLCDKGCKKRVVYLDAMEYNFICPHCENGKLIEAPNQKYVDFLKNLIAKL